MSKTEVEKIRIQYQIITYLIVFISIFVYSFSATAAVSAEELEGYQVDFSSLDHEKEVEIVYQHYLNDPWKDTEFLTRESIGVDLYDIDNDGKKEIIYMMFNPPAVYCGNRGCSLIY